MSLFWIQVVAFLLGTALHVIGRVYEVKLHQHLYYMDKWELEHTQAMQEAAAWSLVGEHAKADEAFAKMRLVTEKYALFFDSIN